MESIRLSTITQFSAEVEGRSYGGGVLKLEPSEAGHLVIPNIPPSLVQKRFNEADRLCCKGDLDGATELVDEILLDSLLTKRELASLRVGLALLRERRLGRNVLNDQAIEGANREGRSWIYRSPAKLQAKPGKNYGQRKRRDTHASQ